MGMTQAVCFKCGESKRAALSACGACKSLPSTRNELMLSVMLTEGYLGASRLAFFARGMSIGRRSVSYTHLTLPTILRV